MVAEQSGKTTESLAAFLIEARTTGVQRLMNAVVAIYGEPIRPYALDAATVLQAMLMEFMLFFVLAPETMKSESPASFMMERLEEMADGMVRKQQPPLLDANLLNDTMTTFRERMGGRPSHAATLIRGAIEHAELDEVRRAEAIASVEVIDAELAKTDGSKVVIKGMIAYLRAFDLKELQEPLTLLEGSL